MAPAYTRIKIMFDVFLKAAKYKNNTHIYGITTIKMVYTHTHNN